MDHNASWPSSSWPSCSPNIIGFVFVSRHRRTTLHSHLGVNRAVQPSVRWRPLSSRELLNSPLVISTSTMADTSRSDFGIYLPSDDILGTHRTYFHGTLEFSVAPSIAFPSVFFEYFTWRQNESSSDFLGFSLHLTNNKLCGYDLNESKGHAALVVSVSLMSIHSTAPHVK